MSEPADLKILHPKNWPPAKGYANGIEAEGRVVFVAGQIGADENLKVVSDSLVDQFGRALENIAAVLAEAGSTPAHICRITGFCTNKAEYLASLKDLGPVWRAVMGRHYPAMSLVFVSALVEDGAKIELEATAVIPKD